ncbi:hypothetical protein AA696_05925 [Salmonella enterica subsp. enterica]|nr:hypothetical protein [Salmonella enterica]EBU7940547.1 hypothetical protein [Salmonella enterica subsp. enterica serovar Chittagong]EBY5127524.1 hypothetical protein [Salmonella enterica subsp. enterica serovar Brazzaville]ECE6340871.1 hypothetical protein [Salmonella enterica subsp. enterica]ECG1257929.1 hypothetical protein [Salmonella enterica subsp. enterica]
MSEPASRPEIIESQEYHACNKQNSDTENVQEFSWNIIRGSRCSSTRAASDTIDTSPAGS